MQYTRHYQQAEKLDQAKGTEEHREKEGQAKGTETEGKAKDTEKKKEEEEKDTKKKPKKAVDKVLQQLSSQAAKVKTRYVAVVSKAASLEEKVANGTSGWSWAAGDDNIGLVTAAGKRLAQKIMVGGLEDFVQMDLQEVRKTADIEEFKQRLQQFNALEPEIAQLETESKKIWKMFQARQA